MGKSAAIPKYAPPQRRYHKLDNTCSKYKTALNIACPYEGVFTELRWDVKLQVERKKKQKSNVIDTDFEPLSTSRQQHIHPLELSAQELSSSDSDDSYVPPEEEQQSAECDITPPSPDGKKIYQRRKAICPKCDGVVLYLSTHLQRTHGVDKRSEEYQTLMDMARRYQGKKV